MLLRKKNSLKNEEETETSLPSCIICVGSTGAGKSATISKYTRLPIQSNKGVSRVTTKCCMYHRPNDKYAWIDTVGWDDAQFEDDETFKDILRFIDENYMTNVKAVVWAIHPNVRCDAVLSSQAKLIEKFAPKVVWNNVIIVVKQSMSPEDDGRGAMTAALDYNANANVQLLGYRFINDDTFNAKQRQKMQDDPSAREAFNVLTDEEVKGALNEAIENIDEPLQVIFRTKKCQDCGQVGDDRLMLKYCHMQPTWIHTGISEECHPGFTEPYRKYYTPGWQLTMSYKNLSRSPSDSDLAVKWSHPGRLLTLPKKLGGGRYSCCYKKKVKRGCVGRWECCGGATDGIGCRTRYNCCQNDIAVVSDGEGCQKRYACCRGRMEDKGCTQVGLKNLIIS